MSGYIDTVSLQYTSTSVLYSVLRNNHSRHTQTNIISAFIKFLVRGVFLKRVVQFCLSVLRPLVMDYTIIYFAYNFHVKVWAVQPCGTQFLYTVELHLYGLIGMTSHPDIQKIRIIGFFFSNSLHRQFEVRLLIFTVRTGIKPFDHA